MVFRDGQWVKWNGHLPGSSVARDGKVVGIYCHGGADPFGNMKQVRLVPVDTDGADLFITIGNKTSPIFLNVNQPGLEAILDRQDIPAKRLAGNPCWEPRP